MDDARRKRGRLAHARGLDAEDSAARLLLSAGLEILERRYRTPHGELDLIARDGTTLVFVEVKARRDAAAAAASLTARQWSRLEAAALHFAEVYRTATNLSERTQPHALPDMRFDVILVGADGRADWIENARGFDEW